MIFFIRASKEKFRTVSSIPRNTKDTFVFWASRPVDVLSYPVPLRRAPPRLDPPVVCPDLGFEK